MITFNLKNQDLVNILLSCGTTFILSKLELYSSQTHLTHIVTDCKVDARGAEYQGTASVTQNGIECQRWDSNEPHVPYHTYTDELFVDGSMSAAENYCRTVEDSDTGPWCYTMDPEVRWEYCDIPLCAA